MLDNRLQYLVNKSGGPDSLLHFGRKQTGSLGAELYFGEYGYKFGLEPTNDNRMMFQTETTIIPGTPNSIYGDTAAGHNETQVTISSAKTVSAMKHSRTYHFHDTSDSTKVKQIHRINDNDYLREDGSNLAAFLYRMQKHHQPQYKRILRTIQMVAPFLVISIYARHPTTPTASNWSGQRKTKTSPSKPVNFRTVLCASYSWQPFCCNLKNLCQAPLLLTNRSLAYILTLYPFLQL